MSKKIGRPKSRAANQGVGQDLGAAADLEHLAEHRAEAHEEGDAAEGRPEASDDHVRDVAQWYSRRERGEHADQDQRHQGVQAHPDDEEEQ
jgi:cytochrome c553